MPIYEYRCLDCSKIFEKIIWTSGQETVACPYCQSANNLRILSAFTKGGGGSGKGIPSPSTCGPSGGGFS
ncbi:MAG: zinc ribbon domain-containing protein [Deltaproteobacteria bacterium]|nr:zinc ribbon domain-containing protein [Deltaproteobacteria bacterium]